jgi:energy-coupling factor transporter ATP-binding protein EcfA2
VVFGREELITAALGIPRKGAINFVVGVNGSGKSSLIRALYRIFRALHAREWPALPVTLAWDRTIGGKTVTAVLHAYARSEAPPYCAVLDQIPPDATLERWDALTAALASNEQRQAEAIGFVQGAEAVSSSLLFAHLPKHVVAYASGADEPWVQQDHPVFTPSEEEAGQYETYDERPAGWSANREWEEELPSRLVEMVNRYTGRPEGAEQRFSGLGELTTEAATRLSHELSSLDETRRRVWLNRQVRRERDDVHFRVRPRHLRHAGITLSLWQAARELRGLVRPTDREALRVRLLEQGGIDTPDDARRVLRELDWFYPTHLSIIYRDGDDHTTAPQLNELFLLVMLADEVIVHPGGRKRAVISLGPVEELELPKKLHAIFPHGLPSPELEQMVERVSRSRTGAEAILRVLSTDDEINSTPFEVFSRLRDWEETGLLEDLTLTVKRLHRRDHADGTAEDVIVTYDQFSDGEQMLLGRMGLLFLLRGQAGSVLLLDEPETHFNDVWKREIVEMINVALLERTEANVIVATHTSIALSDAYAAEVTVLDKVEDEIVPRGVRGGLFGTDPGEVTMNLFRGESSIGVSSTEMLDKLLKTEWRGREYELKAVLDVLGSSFHRAELRAVLKQLQEENNAVTPH